MKHSTLTDIGRIVLDEDFDSPMNQQRVGKLVDSLNEKQQEAIDNLLEKEELGYLNTLLNIFTYDVKDKTGRVFDVMHYRNLGIGLAAVVLLVLGIQKLWIVTTAPQKVLESPVSSLNIQPSVSMKDLAILADNEPLPEKEQVPSYHQKSKKKLSISDTFQETQIDTSSFTPNLEFSALAKRYSKNQKSKYQIQIDANSKDSLIVKFEIKGTGSIQIFNNLGVKVFNATAKEKFFLNLSNQELSPGLYYYKIIKQGKLIKIGQFSIKK